MGNKNSELKSLLLANANEEKISFMKINNFKV